MYVLCVSVPIALFVLLVFICSNSLTPKAVRSLRAGAEAVWTAYTAEMEAGGVAASTVAEIGAEAVGFAAAEVCRTALGFAGGRKWLQGGNCILFLISNNMAIDTLHKNPH